MQPGLVASKPTLKKLHAAKLLGFLKYICTLSFLVLSFNFVSREFCLVIGIGLARKVHVSRKKP